MFCYVLSLLLNALLFMKLSTVVVCSIFIEISVVFIFSSGKYNLLCGIPPEISLVLFYLSR